MKVGRRSSVTSVPLFYMLGPRFTLPIDFDPVLGPVFDISQYSFKGTSFFCKRIFYDYRRLGVYIPFYEPFLFHILKPVGKHFATDADCGLYFSKTLW